MRRLVEQVLPGCPQQCQGQVIGADDMAVVQQQHGAFGGFKQRRLTLEYQQLAAGQALLHHAVGDETRAQRGQPQCVVMQLRCGAGNVQHPHAVTARGPHRGAVAAQDAVAVQIVFGAMDAYRRVFQQGRSDGIGASVLLGPADAGLQGHAFGLLQETGVACRLEDDAGGIGQQHNAGMAAHRVGERVDFGLGCLQQTGMLGQAHVQLAAHQHHGIRLHIGFPRHAALPGTQHRRRRWLGLWCSGEMERHLYSLP